MPTKGQLILKMFLEVVDFLQKTNKKKSLLLLCDLFLFVFWRKIDDLKKPFKLPDL